MARLEFGTITFSDTTTKVQLFTGGKGFRITAIVLKPRAENAGNIFINSDSNVSRTDGFQLLAGDREDWSFTGSVTANNFWAFATSSADNLDWVMEMEN